MLDKKTEAKESKQAFIKSIKAGDLATIDELLASGTDINTKPSWLKEALEASIHNKTPRVFNHLFAVVDKGKLSKEGQRDLIIEIAQRCSWNTFEKRLIFEEFRKKGIPPLPLQLHAACLGDLEKLIESKATFKRGEHTNLALLYAAANGKLDVVTWLLQKCGAKINHGKNHTMTALLCAAYNGHLETVKYLLKNGASINQRDGKGNTALLVAARNGQLKTIKWLLRKGGADINQCSKSGMTALLWAAYNDHLETVIWLITEGGANINQCDRSGMTALLLAAKYGHLEMVKCLVKNGADVKQRDEKGNTALLLAAKHGQLEIVDWLVNKHGKEISKHHITDTTTLLKAAANNQPATMKLLLQKDAAKDNSGITSLRWAVFNDRVKKVKCLLQAGSANVNERDNAINIASMWDLLHGQIKRIRIKLDEFLRKDPDSLNERERTQLKALNTDITKFEGELEQFTFNAEDTERMRPFKETLSNMRNQIQSLGIDSTTNIKKGTVDTPSSFFSPSDTLTAAAPQTVERTALHGLMYKEEEEEDELQPDNRQSTH